MATNRRQASRIWLYILSWRRQYFIKRVKGPMKKALRDMTRHHGVLARIQVLIDVWRIVQSVNRYPEPTKATAKEPTAHVLLDLWDEFEQYNTCSVDLFQAIRRVTVCEAEHDTEYSQRMTWFLKRLTEKYASGEWPPPTSWEPLNFWADPAVQEEKRRARKKLMFRALNLIGRVR